MNDDELVEKWESNAKRLDIQGYHVAAEWVRNCAKELAEANNE